MAENLANEPVLVFASVAGYTPELYNRSATPFQGPCTSLVNQIFSPSREPGTTEHDTIFKVGRWHYDCLLR